MKFIVTYGRKVRSADYETLVITLQDEFDDGVTDRDTAFRLTKEQVEEWIKESLTEIREKLKVKAV